MRLINYIVNQIVGLFLSPESLKINEGKQFNQVRRACGNYGKMYEKLKHPGFIKIIVDV